MLKLLPPLDIVLVTLWSIGRALTAILTLYGTYIFLASALNLWNGSPVEIWSATPLDQQIYIVLFFVKAVVFFTCAVGIFQGKNWGRTGFIVASVAVLVWMIYNTLATLFLWGIFDQPYLVIDSFIAVCLALWYFNRDQTMEYFDASAPFPHWDWIFIKIGHYPVTLLLVFCLAFFRILSEGFGLVTYFSTPALY